MIPEEKAIKMWLVDLPERQQRHYQASMVEWLDKFKDLYHSYDNEEYQQLFVASLGTAMIKFSQYLEEQESK